MRKERIIFWVISLLICGVIITIYQKDQSKIPEEEKQEYKVYCEKEEFKEDIKALIDNSSIGETHKVTFTDSKNTAELIFTDKILASDSGYEKVGWSPLVVAFEDNKDKKKTYEKEGYIIKSDNNSYTIEFDKIIKATLDGEWEERIYCPKLDTREGELFFDFILININDGIYPRNENEMQDCIKKANEFFESSIVVQVDSKDRIKNKKVIKNELYIIFEDDLYNITNDSCSYEISYPTNTVVHEWYLKYTAENAIEVRQCFERRKLGNAFSNLNGIIYNNHIRFENCTAYNYKKVYTESSGFSYVEIPLEKE